jgi:hypothetical protein
MCHNSRAQELFRSQEATNRNDILHQRSNLHVGTGSKCLHSKALQSRSYTCAQRFAEERQAATEHHYFRMDQVSHVGKGETEVIRQFGEDFRGIGVVGPQGLAQAPGFSASLLSDGAGEVAFRVSVAELANSFVDRPARAALFDRRSSSVEADMADFRLTGFGAMEDFPTDDKATPDTTAERDIEDWIPAYTNSFESLPQSGNIGIVVDQDGHAK